MKLFVKSSRKNVGRDLFETSREELGKKSRAKLIYTPHSENSCGSNPMRKSKRILKTPLEKISGRTSVKIAT